MSVFPCPAFIVYRLVRFIAPRRNSPRLFVFILAHILLPRYCILAGFRIPPLLLLFIAACNALVALMEKLADAFVIAPGGIGTMDEFFQVLTLAYLDRKKAPIVIFNIKGYYDSLLEFIEQGVQKGTIHERTKDLFVVRDKPLDVLTAISSFDK